MRLCARLLLVLLPPLCSLFTTGAANTNGLWAKCIQNVPRSFTQSQQEQLCASSRSGSLDYQDPIVPGQCAKLCLGGRPLQSAKFASRVELLRAACIIQLCAGSQSIGPAKCWLAYPARMRQQMLVKHVSALSRTGTETKFEAAAMPLVKTCRHAQDDLPAKCMLIWFDLSKFLGSQDAHDALQSAITLCKGFEGKVHALEHCVKEIAPRLRLSAKSEIGALQLCKEVGDGANLLAMIECVSMLGRKRAAFTTVTQLCAETFGVVRPHVCFLEAQQKLRWMDLDAQISLCKNATADAALAPVDCAMEMKSTAQMLRLSEPAFTSTPQFRVFVAKLCRGATNATTAVECVRGLPAHAFTADQAFRLCAISAVPIEHHVDHDPNVFYPARCASQARLLLRRAVWSDGSNVSDESVAAAAVRVCEQATSDAPSKCLVDTQFDQALSAMFRVQLCRGATSATPQQCVRLLRKFVNAKRMDAHDTVMTCRQAKSLGPAECVTELFQAATSVSGPLAARLCHAAKGLEPARCFAASPPFYSSELKASLCDKAESLAPVLCVESVITRFANQPSVKVSLCRRSATTAPATCAIEAPFGMDEASVILLCQSAVSVAPARCAQEVPTSLSVSWHRIARVCADAKSTIPGRCLAHHVRQSRLLLRAVDANQLVSDCRATVAQPAALGIVRASYNCPKLRPMCPMHIVLNVLDQYGARMAENTQYIHVTATITDTRKHSALQGQSYATVINGSATFSNLVFTEAGDFTLALRAEKHITQEVVRVFVHPDNAADALHSRCDELFTRFQCNAQYSQFQRKLCHHDMQVLLLPRQFQLNAISCGPYWADKIGSFDFRGFFPPDFVLYTLSRPLYDLFTNADYQLPP